MARYLSCLGVTIPVHHINFCMQLEPPRFLCFFFLEEFVIHGSWSWLITLYVCYWGVSMRDSLVVFCACGPKQCAFSSVHGVCDSWLELNLFELMLVFILSV